MAFYGPREDKKVRLFSGNVDGDIVEFDIDDTTVEKDDRFWANYFKGMITYLREKYDNINHGFNLYIKATCHQAQAYHQVLPSKC